MHDDNTDLIKEWARERLEHNMKKGIYISDLYSDYERWSETNNFLPFSKRKVGITIRTLYSQDIKDHKVRIYKKRGMFVQGLQLSD